MHFFEILPVSSLKATSSPKFLKVHCAWQKKIQFFFWKFKIFEKIFWKILPNFIQIYRMYAPPLGAWIMKIWAFEFEIFWKFNTSCYFLNRICNKYQKCCLPRVQWIQAYLFLIGRAESMTTQLTLISTMFVSLCAWRRKKESPCWFN